MVSLVCQTLVDTSDPAFAHPTKFVGPVCTKAVDEWLSFVAGTSRPDGKTWRRVVPSPEPLVPMEMATIRMLVGNGAIVICSGGGGIPVSRGADGLLHGVEAVIDNDQTAVLLARQLGADALLLLTNVANVETAFGTDQARPIFHTTPYVLRAELLPAGSMGPTVDAVCRFVEATGNRAFIGRLDDPIGLIAGKSGTVIEPARGSHLPSALVPTS